MWKSSGFMDQGHVCSPLPNSLTSPVKQATPQRATDTERPVLRPVLGTSPHHRAATDTQSCAQILPAPRNPSGSPSFPD